MKILIMRMSAIGDIVLTTPVVRALRRAMPEAKIHFLVKPQYAQVLEHNPHITKLMPLQKRLRDTIRELKLEDYDYVLDLQKNLRSQYIRWQLKKPSSSFSKENLKKWWMVRSKRATPLAHIVNRYAQALAPLQVRLGSGGLEFQLPPGMQEWADAELKEKLAAHNPYAVGTVAVVLGATHGTKKWPPAHHAALANRIGMPVVLLGGNAETADAEQVAALLKVPYLNAVARYNLHQSAALMQQCSLVITHDTGLMHIAAAFGQPIVSLWGNTLPEFGMTPYHTDYIAAEVKGLHCRPCSKIGYKQCPRGHFKCMKELTPENVFAAIQKRQFLP